MSQKRNIRWGEGGGGFIADGHLFLQRCGKCQRENYGPAVATGACAWCGDVPDLANVETVQ